MAKPLPKTEARPELSVSPTVLLVEDEALLRFAMADTLRGYGFTVVEAVNAEEACALLSSRICIDLVFSDVCLPGTMSGLDLARTIRTKRPEVRLLLTSGTAIEAATNSDCADAFFAKPYDADVVATRIAKLLDHVLTLAPARELRLARMNPIRTRPRQRRR